MSMDHDGASRFITGLYRDILGRKPGASELEHWISLVTGGEAAENIVHKFVMSPENKERNRVHLAFPPGHFFSPIVDPDTVKPYVDRYRNVPPSNILGITIDVGRMVEFWREHFETMQHPPFTDPSKSTRYQFVSDYPPFDAVTLYAMILNNRPRRIIEIGCGFSTLCMLDAADDARLSNLQLTCIEPYPQKLKALLRPGDINRLTLIDRPVQDIPAETFTALDSNDILFIDSTHVLKTASDVHYELFSILPLLSSGVVIHFHDVAYPFEYPDGFIYKMNYSWNEAYAVRAFLMFNSAFEIIFWGSLLAYTRRAEIEAANPLFILNPGGSIWLRRV